MFISILYCTSTYLPDSTFSRFDVGATNNAHISECTLVCDLTGSYVDIINDQNAYRRRTQSEIVRLTSNCHWFATVSQAINWQIDYNFSSLRQPIHRIRSSWEVKEPVPEQIKRGLV